MSRMDTAWSSDVASESASRLVENTRSLTSGLEFLEGGFMSCSMEDDEDTEDDALQRGDPVKISKISIESSSRCSPEELRSSSPKNRGLSMLLDRLEGKSRLRQTVRHLAERGGCARSTESSRAPGGGGVQQQTGPGA